LIREKRVNYVREAEKATGRHLIPMQVIRSGAGELVQLLDGANSDDLLHVVADPEGDRRAPESVPTDGPVLGVSQPVVETPGKTKAAQFAKVRIT
jgi:hypothetical protein